MLSSLYKARTFVLTTLICLLSIGMGSAVVHAEETPASYNYSYWGDAVASPAAYRATALLNGDSLGVGPFKEPNDIHVTADKQIYVLDSGNNRIVVMDASFKLDRIIDSFDNNGEPDKFMSPQGLFVTEDKNIYVADTGNKRVVHLDSKGKLVKVIKNPESELFQENFQFQPARVVVDKAQRIYVMAAGVFDGFMEFNANGDFSAFIGANRVRVDPIELLWKRLSTRAQRSQMAQFTPTEFTNLDIDDEGFIYATNGDRYGETIKKLNAQGNDILRRTGYFSPGGDLVMSSEERTRLIDIDVADSEIYSVLDSRRGRIFTYNGDGHFMYVFGGLGNRLGEFNAPTAIERVGDQLLVLDKGLGEITLFETTEYGRTLNEAVRSYYKGDEEAAFAWFRKSINMNANLEFAYAGIGKALLRQGKYAEAMIYFKQSKDQPNYSKAFLLYRKEVLREYFPATMTGIVLIALGAITFRKLRQWKGGRKRAEMEQ
ncbi:MULTISPECIES: NHL repeat-containing protein [unclassified Paenibacillus]|uniref:NHL repeat-containing protein n=1 Tax=unclassified Paenibacillus TaxID=185978 RepID=UPI0010450EB8|nr:MULTISPECIES: NHL repeat-containing protein [unclassified Paenibacillus]NIK71986.1 tetratricopeptide (TPR) repeat protein [Paenibacillus sp. BK720]TCM89752.1 SMP-30/gluconolaconase/LRE-like protein [Paenibacillus sp. BK033]